MQRMLRLKKILKNSSLTLFSENLKNIKKQDFRYRDLTESEIEILEANGNRSENWSLIQVEQNFTPERIYRTVFIGQVKLPAFFGTLLLPGDVSFPTGIYDSVIHNAVIENALIFKVSMLSNIFVCQGVVLHNIGTLVSNGKIKALSTLEVGNECGGRNLLLFPDIAPEFLEMQLSENTPPEISKEYAKILTEWDAENHFLKSVISTGAVLSNVSVVRNSWIGAYARIEGAAKIRNSFILSSLEETTGIYDSVIVENSIVQNSAKIHSGANVQNAVILKKTKIGKNALITSSVISYCSHIEEAEITNSFVGPLVAAHHHALLISAIWKSGFGNLGYGANVGSNHTGRRPDQEIYPGLGMFFGLGVNIKFPANFKDAPYSLIASGVTTYPQKMQMPFSLITSGNPVKYGLESSLNEIIPGWMYSKNAYALMRNSQKYGVRGKGFVSPTEYSLYKTEIVKNVILALSRLETVPVKEVYTKAEIPGLGSNYLTEPKRQQALKAYQNYLERFILETVLIAVENDSSLSLLSVREIIKSKTGDLFKEKNILAGLPANIFEALKKYRQMQREWQESIQESIARDKIRGEKIFDDYEFSHPEDNEFSEFIKNNYEESVRRINAVLKETKD